MTDLRVIDHHFARRTPAVRKTYDAILSAARTFGSFQQESKKTSIHLVRRSAFAGVATRKDALILTIKSDTDIKDARVHRSEQTSTNRWHVEVKLTAPEQVDDRVRAWLKAAYDLTAYT